MDGLYTRIKKIGINKKSSNRLKIMPDGIIKK
jgi:hypothetical protein